MSTQTICVPVTEDGLVAHSWGRAHTLALATLVNGSLREWRTEVVRWDIAHDEGTEGSHHARVARFIRGHEVTAVIAGHMGDGMHNMLAKLGVDVRLGVEGGAHRAVIATAGASSEIRP